MTLLLDPLCSEESPGALQACDVQHDLVSFLVAPLAKLRGSKILNRASRNHPPSELSQPLTSLLTPGKKRSSALTDLIVGLLQAVFFSAWVEFAALHECPQDAAPGNCNFWASPSQVWRNGPGDMRGFESRPGGIEPGESHLITCGGYRSVEAKCKK